MQPTTSASTQGVAMGSGSDLGEIDQILLNLRQRVLLNETLNNFKKEIN
jgi:hypothetical protein